MRSAASATLGCLLFLLPVFLSAEPLPVRLAPIKNLGPPREDTEETVEIIGEALLSELDRYDIQLLKEDSESGEKTVLLSCAYYLDSLGYLHISLTAADEKGEYIFFGTLAKARMDITLFNTLSGMMEELVTGFLSVASSWIQGTLTDPPPLARSLRIESPDEGASVTLGEALGGGIIEGEVTLMDIPPLAAGSVITLTVEKPGYRTMEHTLVTQPGETTIALPPLIRRTRLVPSVSWSAARLLGAGAGLRYFFLPDRLFAGVEEYLYGAPHDIDSKQVWALHSDSRVFAGGYLFLPPESRFRLSLSAAFQFHLSFLRGSGPDESPPSVYTDYSFDFLCLNLEYAFPDFFLYLQGELYYTFEKEGGFHSPGGHPSLTLGISFPWL